MKWVSLSIISECLNISKPSISKRSNREEWTFRSCLKHGKHIKEFNFDKLPEDVKTALLDKIAITGNTDKVKSLDKITEKNKEMGYVRVEIIKQYQKSGLNKKNFTELYNFGRLDIPYKIKEVYPQIDDVTLWNWEKRYFENGLAGICPQYGNKSAGFCQALSGEDRQIILSMYLTTSKWTIAKCQREFEELFPEKKEIVSYTSLKRFIASLPKALKDWRRNGSKTLNDKFLPYIARDFTRYNVMETWESDHHELDVFCKKGNKVFRPWITVFRDLRSRHVVGVSVSEYPSTESILKALYMGIKLYGAPEEVLFDNGKDYKSKHLQGHEVIFEDGEIIKISGVLHSFGIRTHFARPYHGQSKPIERWFRHVLEDYSKTLSGFIGSNTAITLEEHKSYKKDVLDKLKLTFEEVETSFTKWVNKYNTTWKHQGQGMNGHTPEAVFNEGIKNHIKMEISDECISLLFCKEFTPTVSRSMIKITNIIYFAPELALHNGQKVIVKRDPFNIGSIKVYDKNGLFICNADSELKDTGATQEDIKRVSKAQKLVKKTLNEHLEAVKNIESKDFTTAIKLTASKNERRKKAKPHLVYDVKTKKVSYWGE